MKVDHIGIAVTDLDAGRNFYKAMFPEARYTEISYELGRMDILMIEGENVKIELLKPWDSDSSLSDFIAKRGEGVHHIAYEVSNVEQQMQKVKASGIRTTTEKPFWGAEGSLVFFMHPGDTGGVLYEFFQAHHEAEQ